MQKIKKEEILNDYRIACESREASLVGRKEVFMGKAKFGIFGDGKEVPQLAMAKAFENGDIRSGYYRDQTFMFAIGALTLEQYFAQLYAHTNIDHEPATAGRCMNSHFATRFLHDDGSWKVLTELKNSSADVSPTASQMPRLLGLAFASKLYRNNPLLSDFHNFSIRGNEIAWGTIGNASTSEGMFFETMNAAGVLQVPMIVSVWDDEYGISVPKEYHTVKGDISRVLSGFQPDEENKGIKIFRVKAWDYLKLCEVYFKAAKIAREEHIPVLIHVLEVTQQQGHSTSGSHERYKSEERLSWEQEFDCNKKMRDWLIEMAVASAEELEEIEEAAKKRVKEARANAWKAYTESIKKTQNEAVKLLQNLAGESEHQASINSISEELIKTVNPIRKDTVIAVKRALRAVRGEHSYAKSALIKWLDRLYEIAEDDFSSFLYSQSQDAALHIDTIKPSYSEDSPWVDGREILQACFDHLMEKDPRLVAFGEDLGKIGDVNQGFAGLQDKHGDLRVMDTGIRECTIIGQGIGAAMRGLKPIAEIQYLDYLLYALQILSDDLACLQYRTKGGQKAPMIIRTRGHRLEGIWHSGSPMGTILHALRGIHVLVPRNMTQAAGFYGTLLQSDEPALIIECLNGYRLKEKMPDNIGDYTLALGVPEILKEGEDITIVTYGSMCRIVEEAALQLEEVGISCEIIDVQTLLPFDIHHLIVDSIKKTNRVIFADEDVPGGASAFMMQKVLEEQNAYYWLDSPPKTLCAKEHRPAYASDGDYFSKPNVESVFDSVYEMMHEVDPEQFPKIY